MGIEQRREAGVGRVALATALIAALVATAWLPAVALAGNASGWSSGAGAGKLTMKDLIPKMSADEAYSERYGFSVDLDGGGHVGFDFTVSNLGWGDAMGASSVRVRLPGQQKYSYSKKADEGEWRHASDRFALDIGSSSVEQVGADAFRLRHEAGPVDVDLTFTNTMPMWRPGDGQITTDEGYYKFGLIAPRADVKGHVTIGGKRHEVDTKAAGYADHVATNVAPFDLAKRFSRFRDYNGDVFVIWREIQMEEEHGGQSFTWIMVGYKDQIVFSDASATARLGRIKADPQTDYAVPYSLQIDGRSGKDTVKLVHRSKRMKRKDLLAEYGSPAKLVASAVSEPYQFDLTGDYTLQMTIKGATAQVEGKGHYTIDYINK